MIAAVLVPPSAWTTSQSTRTIASPMAFMSTAARRARPISLEISLARPPDTWSLRTLSCDEPGSIAYSAVTHPFPVSFIHRGTSSETEAVHKTRVPPIEMRTDPGVASVKPISRVTGRS